MDTAYLKRVGVLIAGILLSIGLVFYIGYHSFHALTASVVTEPAREVTVSVSDDISVFIMRSERVLTSTSGSGGFVPLRSDGEKAALGDAVCGIYDRADAASRRGLSEIDIQMRMLRDSLDSGLSVKDTSRLDSEIYALMEQIRIASEDGRLSDAAGLRSELVSLYSKRLAVTGGSSSIAAQLDELDTRRSALVAQMGSLRETVSAPVSGYYYHDTDGYESVFDASRVGTMTYADVVNMTSAAPVSEPAACGKIVTDYKWYAVFFTDGDYKEGKYLSVTFPFNRNAAFDMKVERVIGGEGAPDAVVLSSDRVPSDFTFTRVQPAKLLETEYTGFSVPVSAVRIVDGVKGVYVLTGSTVHFRKISVIAEHEDRYIVDTDPDETAGEETETTAETDSATSAADNAVAYKWLRINENVIVEGKGMYDGRVIAG